MKINAVMAELKLWFGSAKEPPHGEVPVATPKIETLSSPSHHPLCFVVDDEPAVRRLISTVLKPMGIQVEEFASAPALIKGLESHHPHLIFLDISLEHSDAVEALQGLTEHRYKGAVNLMSGQHSQLLEEIGKIGTRQELRMLPALLKPFEIAKVRAVASAIFATAPKPVPQVSIDEALRHGWMTVHYQPKIHLKRKLLVGCEALARIQHPQHGIILPGAFLPGADSGSLERLTEHVLLTVLRDSVRFKEAGASLRPAVNIPFGLLLSMPVAALVRENKPKGDAWKGLIVEVTEDQIVRDMVSAEEIATHLKIYDILLSIDRFGVGLSSLARLKHFPFSELKIDMSFVAGCASNPKNAAICKAAIELAHSFGALAVAEGLEKADDLHALFSMGCDLGQGHLFTAPLPIERLIPILERRASKARELTA